MTHRDSIVDFLQRALFALGVLTSLVFFFYAFENWRGRRAWEKFARQMKEQGESLDWRDYARQPVPDAQNVMSAPVLAAIASPEAAPAGVWDKFQDNPVSKCSFDSGVWREGRVIDLAACDAILRDDGQAAPDRRMAATNILRVLSTLDSEFAEMRQASARRFSQFPGDGSPGGPMPKMVALRTLANVLALRASAELAAGKADEAFADAVVIERIAEALLSERHLVGAMMGTAMLASMELQVFWEGLATVQWSDDQLQHFQSTFASTDLLKALDRALRGGERAGVDFLVQQPGTRLQDLFGNGARVPGMQALLADWYYRAWPRGWVYQNQVVHNRLISATALTGYSVARQRVYPEKCLANIATLNRAFASWSPFGHLAAAGIPNFERASKTVARTQTFINEAAIACVLERFRRAHQEYPGALETLVPGYIRSLPHDLLTGRSLIYRRTGASSYRLYSVGWDETDDGGASDVAVGQGQPAASVKGVDWVWPSPELPATSR